MNSLRAEINIVSAKRARLELDHIVRPQRRYCPYLFNTAIMSVEHGHHTPDNFNAALAIGIGLNIAVVAIEVEHFDIDHVTLQVMRVPFATPCAPRDHAEHTAAGGHHV